MLRVGLQTAAECTRTVWRVRSGARWARTGLLTQRHFPVVRGASVSLTVRHHGPVWCRADVKSSLWPLLFQYNHSLLIKQRLPAAVFRCTERAIDFEVQVQVFSLLVPSCNENVFVKRRCARWPDRIRTRLFLWAD